MIKKEIDELIQQAKAEFLNEEVVKESDLETTQEQSYAKGWNACNRHWIKVINEYGEIESQESEESKMKIYTNCREAFVDAITKVFKDDDIFFDFIEDKLYASSSYDCVVAGDDECYIINRDTGDYINWYKFTHIGRRIHSTVSPDNFEDFLQKFYESKLWDWED